MPNLVAHTTYAGLDCYSVPTVVADGFGLEAMEYDEIAYCWYSFDDRDYTDMMLHV